MKTTICSKLLFQLLLIFTGSIWVNAQYVGTGTFTKISTMTELTDGYYVLVNSGDAYAMNNIEGKYFDKTDVTPLSGKIINPPAFIVTFLGASTT